MKGYFEKLSFFDTIRILCNYTLMTLEVKGTIDNSSFPPLSFCGKTYLETYVGADLGVLGGSYHYILCS